MSPDLEAQTSGKRISGKWQVPLFLLSWVVFFSALLHVRPDAQRPPVEELVAHLGSLKSGLLLPEAESLARSVLEHEYYVKEELGPIHAQYADILFRIQEDEAFQDQRVLLQILKSYAQAELLGYQLTGDDFMNRARVHEWLDQPKDALEQYELSSRNGPGDPIEVRRRILALKLGDRRFTQDDVYRALVRLMADALERPKILKWALSRAVELLAEMQKLDEARELIAQYQPQLEGTEHELFFNYLSAWVYYRAGAHEQAELILRDLRSRLHVRDDLHAMSGWLLGRVILMDDKGLQRPLEALSFFEDVVNAHTTGQYVTASLLGIAEALSDLHRFDEALRHYKRVLDVLQGAPEQGGLVDQRAVSQSLALRSRMQQRDDQLDSAVDYMQLATDLVGAEEEGDLRSIYLYELGMLKKKTAEQYQDRAQKLTEDSDEQAANLEQRSRELFLSAAEDFFELSRLQINDEARSAGALWRAADLFDSAGRSERTIELLEGFLENRPSSIQVPQVLYRLGQAYQALGMLDSAVEHYQQCIRDYLRTSFAQRSLLPLADCYLMMGSQKTQEAEETLLFILEGAPGQPELFTPESGIYRDALFRIGDLYARDGRYEEAIARLDEAMQRYPNDPRRQRATFLLADAYRHSGLELQQAAADLSNALRREELQNKKRMRLNRAEELFADVIETSSSKDPADLSPMARLQLKLSYVYRADCAFELNNLQKALELYQEVVRVFPEDPVALSAYIQIVNCLEGLGRHPEIIPALRRAQWLADKMDTQETKSALLRDDPESWKRLLDWIEQTGQYAQRSGANP